MSLWGNVDASNNAPNFSGLTGYDTSTTGQSLANSQPSSVFGNTYISATRTGVQFGVFGIDATEEAVLRAGTNGAPTHAGWVARTAGLGPIVSITANAGAVGVNATMTITGGGENNTPATVIVNTNAAGYITSVDVPVQGLYASTPTINAMSNAVFTITMGGRANRVQYETLVAMGSMTGDASDDAIAPDA